MHHKFFQLNAKSFDEYQVKTHQELWEKVKENGFTALQCSFVTQFVKSETQPGEEVTNKFHAVLSDSIEDRHGDIVKQEWVLTNFKKNPVLLDSHDYSSIEKIIGKWLDIGVTDDRLQGDIEFALMNPRGVLARDLAEGGFLTALSAGFIPLSFGEKGEIIKSELLEGSMVSVPANPRTLLEKGIEKKEEGEETVEAETVDEEEPKDEVEVKTITREKSIVQKLEAELTKQNNILKAVATELKKGNGENVAEVKRKIWKELRKAL